MLGTYLSIKTHPRAMLARSPGYESKEVSQGHSHGDWLQYKACAGLGLTAPSWGMPQECTHGLRAARAMPVLSFRNAAARSHSCLIGAHSVDGGWWMADVSEYIRIAAP